MRGDVLQSQGDTIFSEYPPSDCYTNIKTTVLFCKRCIVFLCYSKCFAGNTRRPRRAASAAPSDRIGRASRCRRPGVVGGVCIPSGVAREVRSGADDGGEVMPEGYGRLSEWGCPHELVCESPSRRYSLLIAAFRCIDRAINARVTETLKQPLDCYQLRSLNRSR